MERSVSDDEDDCIDSIGFMFDSQHSKITKTVTVGDVSLSVRIISEDPGHVQSGQYLWPAAHYLAHYLLKNWESLKCGLVVELGAGAGLCGLLVSVLGDRSQRIVMTDYDPGCVDILLENIELNGSSGNCEARCYEWGEDLPTEILRSVQVDACLIIGSDLLYCSSVVRPLFVSVAKLLHSGGVFVLASSFDIGKDVEDEVSLTCKALKFHVDEVIPLNLTSGQFRIQHFTLPG